MHFILSDNSNYDFNVKVRCCGFVVFVNYVIDCECLGCVFCFRINYEERERHILDKFLFYNIPPKFFFLIFLFYFSSLQLNNYNG